MGAQESKSSKYDHLFNIFTKPERENIEILIQKLGIESTQITCEYFNQELGNFLCSPLDTMLYEFFDQCKSEEKFISALGSILKGTGHDKAVLINFCMCYDKKTSPCFQFETIFNILNLFMGSYINIIKRKKHLPSLFDVCEANISDIIETEIGNEISFCDKTAEDILQRWLMKSSFFSSILEFVFSHCFSDYMQNRIDNESISGDLPIFHDINFIKCKYLIDLPSLLYLNHHLPHDLQKEWRFLFSSVIHGESFSTMQRRITQNGPILIIIKDEDDNVFGGFVSQPLCAYPQFYGSHCCFLFTLKPKVHIYSSIGINENYVYFNYGQETLPNGFGMGGQLNHFGLWLDFDYGKGKSVAKPRCITYDSPMLSSKENFVVKQIEVWGVGGIHTNEDDEDSIDSKNNGSSILEKDPEAKAMLQLIGKCDHSAGFKDQD